jgi:hypothetical protein
MAAPSPTRCWRPAGDVDGFLARHATAISRFRAVRDSASTAREDAVILLAVLTGELHRLRQSAV